MDVEIRSQPFSWNEDMAEVAIEDMESLRINITYAKYQNIMMALTKLDLLEKQGKQVENIGALEAWKADMIESLHKYDAETVDEVYQKGYMKGIEDGVKGAMIE